MVGVEDLHLAVGLDIAGSNHTFAGGFDVDRLGALAVEFGNDALYVQDNLGYILFHTGDRAELMLNACNLDARNCGSGQ